MYGFVGMRRAEGRISESVSVWMGGLVCEEFVISREMKIKFSPVPLHFKRKAVQLFNYRRAGSNHNCWVVSAVYTLQLNVSRSQAQRVVLGNRIMWPRKRPCFSGYCRGVKSLRVASCSDGRNVKGGQFGMEEEQMINGQKISSSQQITASPSYYVH